MNVCCENIGPAGKLGKIGSCSFASSTLSLVLAGRRCADRTPAGAKIIRIAFFVAKIIGLFVAKITGLFV